jgi:predicted secreted protein
MAGSVVQAGTVDFGGYVDISENDYKELLKLEDTQEETVWRITLPNNGYIVFPAVISQITWDIPLEGAVAYSGTAVLKSEAEHLF